MRAFLARWLIIAGFTATAVALTFMTLRDQGATPEVLAKSALYGAWAATLISPMFEIVSFQGRRFFARLPEGANASLGMASMLLVVAALTAGLHPQSGGAWIAVGTAVLCLAHHLWARFRRGGARERSAART